MLVQRAIGEMQEHLKVVSLLKCWPEPWVSDERNITPI